MKQDRPFELILAQQTHVKVVVEHSVTCGDVTRFSVVIEILRVTQHNIFAHQRKRTIEDLLHAGQFPLVEKIRRIHRDFEMRRADLIQKASSFRGGIHYIAHFWLEGEYNVRLPSNVAASTAGSPAG